MYYQKKHGKTSAIAFLRNLLIVSFPFNILVPLCISFQMRGHWTSADFQYGFYSTFPGRILVFDLKNPKNAQKSAQVRKNYPTKASLIETIGLKHFLDAHQVSTKIDDFWCFGASISSMMQLMMQKNRVKKGKRNKVGNPF